MNFSNASSKYVSGVPTLFKMLTFQFAFSASLKTVRFLSESA